MRVFIFFTPRRLIFFLVVACAILGDKTQAQNTGSLQVNIIPEGAINAGAQWQVDDGIPQPSGATVLGLSVGNHTVIFSTVSGWTSPFNQTISVSVNSTATATGNYAQSPYNYTTNNDTIT